MQDNWIEKNVNDIDSNCNFMSASMVRAYKIKRLKKILAFISEYKNECDSCKIYSQQISFITKHFYYFITENENEYFKLIHEITIHLKLEHGINFMFFYTTVISVLGLLAGLIIGLVLAIFVDSLGFASGIGFGLLIGLGAGLIIGFLSDMWTVKKGRCII